MKKTALIIAMMVSICTLLSAQVNFTANTGDSEFDLSLKDINTKANSDLQIFKKDLSINFKIGVPKIEQLMATYKMAPADIYMTLQIGQQTGKTPDAVALSYEKNKGQGWGVIAKEMGIKPGSPEFHALKGKAKDKGGKMKSKGNGNKGKGKSKAK